MGTPAPPLAPPPPPSSGARSWADLLRTLPSKPSAGAVFNEQLRRVQASTLGNVCFSKEELQGPWDEWKCSLIGRFFGKAPPLAILRKDLLKLWHLQDDLKIIDLMEGFFVFRFGNDEDMMDALTESPWSIRGLPLTLFPWRPGFRALAEEVTTAPIWVQFPDLPLEFWNPVLLSKIAASLGRPLKVDQCTINRERGKFARICIEMDITSPLPQGTWIETGEFRFFQPVEFDRIPVFCFRCGRLGHKSEDCASCKSSGKKATGATQSPASSQPADPTCGPQEATLVGDEPLFGPWLRVQRRKARSTSAATSRRSRPEEASVGGRSSAGARPVSPSPAAPPPAGPGASSVGLVPVGPRSGPALFPISGGMHPSHSPPFPISHPSNPILAGPLDPSRHQDASPHLPPPPLPSGSPMEGPGTSVLARPGSGHLAPALPRAGSPTRVGSCSRSLSPERAVAMAKEAFVRAEQEAINSTPLSQASTAYEDPDLRQAIVPWAHPSSKGDKKKGGGLHLHPRSASLVLKRQKTHGAP